MINKEEELELKDINSGEKIKYAATKDDLMMLARQTKTKAEKIKDILILFLPIIAYFIHMAEYYYMPNKPGNVNTHVYGIFLTMLAAMYTCGLIASKFNYKTFLYLRHKAPFYTLVFVILLVFDILTLKTGVLIMPYFPWADKVFNAAIEDRLYLLDCVKNSLILLFTGYSIGVILGIITGILCGYSENISYWIMPFIKLLGPIPSTTWLPLVMVLMNSLFKGAVFIISLGVWFSVSIATITGIRNVNREYYMVARTLGATSNQLVTKIAIPSALPSIFQGMTQGMSSACTALLVAEMLGVESGLGWYITWQKSWAEFPKMYAAIVIICITFILVNWILNSIKKGVLKWQEV